MKTGVPKGSRTPVTAVKGHLHPFIYLAIQRPVCPKNAKLGCGRNS